MKGTEKIVMREQISKVTFNILFSQLRKKGKIGYRLFVRAVFFFDIRLLE